MGGGGGGYRERHMMQAHLSLDVSREAHDASTCGKSLWIEAVFTRWGGGGSRLQCRSLAPSQGILLYGM